MIVDDVVLVFTNDVHRAQHIQCIINAPLNVFEIYFLTNLSNQLIMSG